MRDWKNERGESLDHLLLKKLLEYYRLQRHDCLNHGQVIMGYLQLGQTEKALQYMREEIGNLEAEQTAGQIAQETVAAIILGLVIAFRKEGIPVEFYLEEHLKTPKFWEEFWQEEYGQALYGYTRECVETLLEKKLHFEYENPEVYFSLTGSNGFCCHFKVMQGEETLWENRLELWKSGSR